MLDFLSDDDYGGGFNNDYSSQIDDAVRRYSAIYDVPSSWIQSIITAESSRNPNAHNSGDGYGLMQLLPSTSRDMGYLGTPEGLFDIDTNIAVGTKYIAWIRDRWPGYRDDLRYIYSAYNSGRPENWLTNFSVRSNVERVMSYLMPYADNIVQVATSNFEWFIMAGLVFLLIRGK